MKFDSHDTQILIRNLRSLTSPAQRHKCPKCETVFECHLCTIEADHPLHYSDNAQFTCEECFIALGGGSVTVLTGRWVQGRFYREYDYLTGQVLSEFSGYIRGWGEPRLTREVK